MSTSNPKPAAPQVNPIIAKAAAGLRKRRRIAPMSAFAPTPGQLELFEPAEMEDQP